MKATFLLVTAIMLCVGVAAASEHGSSVTIGDTTIYEDGVTAHRVGKTTIYSNGEADRELGHGTIMHDNSPQYDRNSEQRFEFHRNYNDNDEDDD